MSHHQDPAAADAPVDSTKGIAVRGVDQDRSVDAQAEPRIIEVVARRFSFEPARIEVAQGERVKIVVKSLDGVHGIEIKKFKVNQKIPRGGEPVTVEFVAGSPGEFPILCSEYCGKDHDDMRGMLIVTAK